jgi:hypothetical protein
MVSLPVQFSKSILVIVSHVKSQQTRAVWLADTKKSIDFANQICYYGTVTIIIKLYKLITIGD